VGGGEVHVSRRRVVDPPLAAAVHEGRGEVHLAVPVDVGHLVDFGGREAGGGHAGEHAVAIVQRDDRVPAAVAVKDQVEVAVAVQVDEVLAAEPPVGVGLVHLADDGPDAAGGGDVDERTARRRRGRQRRVHGQRGGVGDGVTGGVTHDRAEQV